MRSKASSMSLHDYLDSFHSAISKIEDFGFSESIDIKVEIRPSKQDACKARVVLIDGSVLQIRVTPIIKHPATPPRGSIEP